jgi:hypothetical protein
MLPFDTLLKRGLLNLSLREYREEKRDCQEENSPWLWKIILYIGFQLFFGYPWLWLLKVEGVARSLFEHLARGRQLHFIGSVEHGHCAKALREEPGAPPDNVGSPVIVNQQA